MSIAQVHEGQKIESLYAGYRQVFRTVAARHGEQFLQIEMSMCSRKFFGKASRDDTEKITEVKKENGLPIALLSFCSCGPDVPMVYDFPAPD